MRTAMETISASAGSRLVVSKSSATHSSPAGRAKSGKLPPETSCQASGGASGIHIAIA
jgi:hypothetical protein